MKRSNLYAWLAVLPSLAFSTSGFLQAQELNWRHNYLLARKEALDAGRPLLLDFGTEACIWCRKQDATTFRDPRMVKLLSERFIPVKVDGERDANLVRALGIESFPTLVLASPEGKVLGRLEGYADVAQLSTLLAKAPMRLEPASPSATAQAKALHDGNKPLGIESPLPSLTAASSELLRQARAEYDAGHYAESLARCGQTVANNPGEVERLEARKLIQLISTNSVAQRQIREHIDANLEKLQLKLAAALER